MVKTGAGKSLYFMQFFLHYILFGENFIGKVKVTLNLVCLNLKKEKQNSNQNVKVGKMVVLGKVVVLVKAFDHYYHKFQFCNCPVKM